MAEVPAAVPAGPVTMVCKLCGLKYDPSAGRMHGRTFKCTPCDSAERNVRRNLGEHKPLNEWENSECEAFFKRLHAAKAKDPQGRLMWTTVRANMLTTLCEQDISKFSSICDVVSLPLSVWLKKGWEESVIRQQPSEESEEYGCTVYKLPSKKLRWKETFETEEAKLLQKEKECAQKKQAKGKKNAGADADELDVPMAAQGEGKKSEAKAEENDEKQAARERKKMLQSNEKIANLAARAVGPLTAAATSLTKLMEKAEPHRESIEPGVFTCAEDVLAKVAPWSTAAREAMNQQDVNKNGSPEACVALEPLPFSGEEMKLAMKTNAEAAKALRAAIPKRAAAKSKAKENTQDDGAKNAEEPKPKRRRAKSAA